MDTDITIMIIIGAIAAIAFLIPICLLIYGFVKSQIDDFAGGDTGWLGIIISIIIVIMIIYAIAHSDGDVDFRHS